MAAFGAHGMLVKSGRLDFASDLQGAMGLQGGQHRAHVIPYAEITRAVIDPVNRARQTGDMSWLNAVWNLIMTLYPNGDTQRRHTGPNAASLAAIAARYYEHALKAYHAIGQLVSSGHWMGLDSQVNELIGALNCSPDNLRPGSGSTNSSIQEALDPQPRSFQPVEVLPAGTAVVVPSTMHGEQYLTTGLGHNATVLRITELDELMIWKLLTTTWTAVDAVHLFSSGARLQSSDYAGMRTGNMTNANPTHVAIRVPHKPHYFLFTL